MREMNDLQLVAIAQGHIRIGRFGNDFQVSFYRDLAGIKAQIFQQAFDCGRRVDGPFFAVNCDIHDFDTALNFISGSGDSMFRLVSPCNTVNASFTPK